MARHDDFEDTAHRRVLGDRIRSRRADMTQETLAESAGITREYLSRIEAGHSNPSLDVLRGIAAALDLTLSDLFKGI